MPTQFVTKHARALIGAGAGLMLALSMPSTGALADNGPFGDLAGKWTGGGTIAVKAGTKERLRCKVAYFTTQTGKSFQQNMTCASDSYKFVVVSNIYLNGSSISGSWTETTRDAKGSVTGKADSTKISASVRGTGFSATLAISWHGDQQSVLIRPTGTDVTEVALSLNRVS